MSITPKSTISQLKLFIKSKGFDVPNLLKADLYEYARTIHDSADDELSEWLATEIKYPVKYESVELRNEYRGDDLPYEDMIELRLSHLYTYGWTVMPKVPEFDPEETFNEMLEWFKLGNPEIDTSKYQEWKDAHITTRLHGIIKTRSGHESWQWNARKLYKKYFEQLWQTKDLLCSFDGWNFSVKSNKKRGVDESLSKGWMHIDQTRSDREFRCVQGLVCVTDVTESDNSLILLEESHNLFSEYLDKRPFHGWEWCFIDGKVKLSDHPIPIKDRIHQKISAKAGEMIMWDSRLMHQAGDISHSNVRAVIYISMMPLECCSEEDRQLRIKTFESNKMTNHWCYNLNFEDKTIKTLRINSDYMMGIRPKYLPPVRELDEEVRTDPEVRKMVGYLE